MHRTRKKTELCRKRAKPEQHHDDSEEQSGSKKQHTAPLKMLSTQSEKNPSSVLENQQERSTVLDDESVANIKQLGDEMEDQGSCFSDEVLFGSRNYHLADFTEPPEFEQITARSQGPCTEHPLNSAGQDDEVHQAS
jgi:hypothetical protein